MIKKKKKELKNAKDEIEGVRHESVLFRGIQKPLKHSYLKEIDEFQIFILKTGHASFL